MEVVEKKKKWVWLVEVDMGGEEGGGLGAGGGVGLWR